MSPTFFFIKLGAHKQCICNLRDVSPCFCPDVESLSVGFENSSPSSLEKKTHHQTKKERKKKSKVLPLQNNVSVKQPDRSIPNILENS